MRGTHSKAEEAKNNRMTRKGKKKANRHVAGALSII